MREPVIPRLSGTAFIQWEESQTGKFELHRGFIYAFAGGTVDHDRIAFNMRTLLEQTLRLPCRTYGSDVKVRVGENGSYYPDVTVSCEEPKHAATILKEPKIIVEVLSPSTKNHDLVEKRISYQEMKVLKNYVIIHSDRRRVEVDQRSRSGLWETEVFDGEYVVIGGESLQFDQLYAGTALEAIR